ncbi:MAG: sirohydrochlorin chelatase [Devosiaceae bacterium]|nr:sirohydrochlorin chelatase [Devosiaceae bacterium]
MLCGHGSRNQLAVAEFAALSERLKSALPGVPVEYGYLEFADPVIHFGLDRLRAAGIKKVLAIPGMLFAAGHAKNDIPSVLNTYAAMHDDFEIIYGRDLGVDLKLIRAASERIGEAEESSANDVTRHDTLLMVVGRGASDPDANSNVAKVTRMLWEGMGFGWAQTAYSGVTFPLVAPALDQAVKLGFKRIIVFPYFLFTGVLVNRIYDAVDEAANKFTDIEFLKAPYLNDHDLVVETFIERLHEIEQGQNLMNCSMCKFREQVLGFEDEVGAVQESHHHHVEGIGGGLENCPCNGDCDASCRDEDFCKTHGLEFTPVHNHSHSHDHDDHSHDHNDDHAKHDHDDDHHHPYPHADHPMGPVTLPKIQGPRARAQKAAKNTLDN